MNRFRTFAGLCSAVLIWGNAAAAATFTGEYWKVGFGFGGLAAAEAVIAGRAPDATFQSSLIDYPQGDGVNTASPTTIAGFLGTDAASLSGSGADDTNNVVFRFTGFIDLAAGAHVFTVGHDDGFKLTVNNVLVSSFAGFTGFTETTVNADVGSGVVPLELIFYQGGGGLGVEFKVDGAFGAPVSAVPVPASLPLLLVGVAGLAMSGRRHRRRQCAQLKG